MILLYTIASITILLMGAIVIGLLMIKPKPTWIRFFILLYIYNFFSDLSMLLTAVFKMRNHAIANFHVLLFGIGMLMMLSFIWERLLQKKLPNPVIIILSLVYTAVWVVDGFLLHEFTTFNPFGQMFIFIINLCIVVYLLNVSLFTKKKGYLMTTDRYLIFAFLIHCFGAILIDSFFNFYITLPIEVYHVTSFIGLVLGLFTNLLVFLAVRCLVVNRKSSLQ